MSDNQGRAVLTPDLAHTALAVFSDRRASLSEVVTTLKQYAGKCDQVCAAEGAPPAERAEPIASLEHSGDKVRPPVIRGAIERGNVLYLPDGRTSPAA